MPLVMLIKDDFRFLKWDDLRFLKSTCVFTWTLVFNEIITWYIRPLTKLQRNETWNDI